MSKEDIEKQITDCEQEKSALKNKIKDLKGKLSALIHSEKKDCYHCAYVDKVMHGYDGIHCAHGHLEGKAAWRPMHADACEYFERYTGKLD